MTTGIVISVASSLIVLFVTLFVKDYIDKSKNVDVHKHLIESVDRLQNETKDKNEEIIELKNEVDYLRDKIDRLESYISILKAHITDGNPPPPPEKKWAETKDHKIVDII